jgi:hypothetical protein
MNPYYNNNMYQVGELLYQNFMVNNSFKILLFIAYFLMMPLVLLFDFTLT